MKENKLKMPATRQLGSWVFTWNEEESCYECQGPIVYDDEHDEVPDSSLWNAALIIEQSFAAKGYHTEAQHSEKGWVEVIIKTR